MTAVHKILSLPTPEQSLPGRKEPMPIENTHYVLDRPIKPPFAKDLQQVLLGMGCFWGAERKFWDLPGVYTTAVGYSAGVTPNPSYEEVCTGLTGHNEVVLVVYNEQEISFAEILKIFFEAHNPTQGMRQGNDQGTQYRSGIYVYFEEQTAQAEAAKQQYQKALFAAGHGSITTEIEQASEFYYAEQYHQQYIAKNPHGYCGLGGTGVSCTI